MNTRIKLKTISASFLLTVIIFSLSACNKGNSANLPPDFRGLIISKSTLEDFKRSDDFKNCKNVSDNYDGGYLKDLASIFECSGPSPHIDTMLLVFSNADNNQLVTINVKFKDEKNVRIGSQSVYESLKAKYLTNNSKPSFSLVKSQVIQFLSDDSFRAECGTTDCGGDMYYHDNDKVVTSIKYMWYASGNAVLELSSTNEVYMKIVDAAKERANKGSASQAKSLGI